MEASLPSGTVTFLFTDIEGSTNLAQEHPEAWEGVRARHNAILQTAVESHRGHVFKTVGDAFCAAFGTAASGIQAAVEIQRQLQAEHWGDAPVRVRMGIHTGEAQPESDDYTGYLTLTRVNRLMSAAHGGQILLSNASAELIRADLAEGLSLRDLGLHRLKNLPQSEHIWQLNAPGLPGEFPPLQSAGTLPNNLPVQLTSFIGREKELAEVGELLHSHRLVTLTGAGGTGKTRLALQLAESVLADFKDGVWLIELAPLSDPALVPTAVSSELGVREEHGRSSLSTLLSWLAGRELLLVLDNCEHLVEACAKFAETVLRSDRSARILATSREAIGIPGEMAYHVPSLESPAPAQASTARADELTRYPAVRLFAERAREALPSFGVTDANAAEVLQICHRLDGIPLAIELAAARVKVLAVGQIAARLDDRFHLLTGGGRTSLPRHQTLRSLIDWSYGLLGDQERLLLRRLSTFAGGWGLEAAEQVCGGEHIPSSEILNLLTRLVDKSLVTASPEAQESRYGMLETIRQYAIERLIDSGEAAQVRGRHLSYVQGLAGQGDSLALRLDQSLWYDKMELELDNVRAALEWALQLPEPEPALKLSGALHWFWFTRGHWQEGRRWLEEALGRPEAQHSSQGRAWALTALGFFHLSGGDYAVGQQLLGDAINVCREIGDRRSLVHALAWRGSLAGLWGDYAGGSKVLEEALALSRELNDKLAMGVSLVGLGNLRVSEGNDREAQSHFEESSTLLEEVGDTNMLAWARRQLGNIALRAGDLDHGIALCVESLNLNLEINDRRGLAACLAAIAAICVQKDEPSVAARLYGASEALVESWSEQLMPFDVAELRPYVDATRTRLGQHEYERMFSEGRRMSMAEAVAYALEQKG
jgi:predicted ATPase/class 3 adenylate cyclase